MEKTLIDANKQKNIDSWLNGDFPEEVKKSIKEQISCNPSELFDSFTDI